MNAASVASFGQLLVAQIPGLLISVGYMDPGNWATDLAGGAQFGYTLLSVILISNLMAILLQHLSLKLGIGRPESLAVPTQQANRKLQSNAYFESSRRLTCE